MNSAAILAAQSGDVSIVTTDADGHLAFSSFTIPVNATFCDEPVAGSFECGTGAVASSANSTAVGQNAQATASGATAFGNGANASNFNATAVGQMQATGVNASAYGFNSTASGSRSTASGDGSTASGFESARHRRYRYCERQQQHGHRLRRHCERAKQHGHRPARHGHRQQQHRTPRVTCYCQRHQQHGGWCNSLVQAARITMQVQRRSAQGRKQVRLAQADQRHGDRH